MSLFDETFGVAAAEGEHSGDSNVSCTLSTNRYLDYAGAAHKSQSTVFFKTISFVLRLNIEKFSKVY